MFLAGFRPACGLALWAHGLSASARLRPEAHGPQGAHDLLDTDPEQRQPLVHGEPEHTATSSAEFPSVLGSAHEHVGACESFLAQFVADNRLPPPSYCAGQQGRKLLAKLYSLDTDTFTWRRHNLDSLPSPRAGHTMVAAGNRALYVFGGQGKKLLNDLLAFTPGVDSAGFRTLPERGRVPTPRCGVWELPVHSTDGSALCMHPLPPLPISPIIASGRMHLHNEPPFLKQLLTPPTRPCALCTGVATAWCGTERTASSSLEARQPAASTRHSTCTRYHAGNGARPQQPARPPQRARSTQPRCWGRTPWPCLAAATHRCAWGARAQPRAQGAFVIVVVVLPVVVVAAAVMVVVAVVVVMMMDDNVSSTVCLAQHTQHPAAALQSPSIRPALLSAGPLLQRRARAGHHHLHMVQAPDPQHSARPPLPPQLPHRQRAVSDPSFPQACWDAYR